MSESGKWYVLIVVAFPTRYPVAVALKNSEAESLAEALLEVWCRPGHFQGIFFIDRGTLKNDVVRVVKRFVFIKNLATTPYHAQCTV